MGLNDMMTQYRQTLHSLYDRREKLCREIGSFGRRLAVLDEEIDEMEEAIMQMRPYVQRSERA